MADVIQFNCPSCGTLLRLPLSMAASHGPCPGCHAEIIAPDPYRGIGAHLPVPIREPATQEVFRPFVDSPPLRPAIQQIKEAAGFEAESIPIRVSPEAPEPVDPPPVEAPEIVPDPPQVVPATIAPDAGNRKAVFVLALLLTAFVCMAAGYLLGARSNWIIANTPFPKLEIPPTEATEKPVEEPPTKTVLIKPLPDEAADPPKPIPDASPGITSAIAKKALTAFLEAPDWSTRSAYVLFPEKVRPAMQSYALESDDGPTAFNSITVENSHIDRETGHTVLIFRVVTDNHTDGIPVAVAETTSGWQVDWESFVEFRDDHFRSFVEGPADQTGRFHLMVRNPPAPRAANTENEHFSSFLIDPPLPGRQRMAYVRKTAEIHSRLSRATSTGIHYPVLEVTRRTTPDGKPYLEITDILADDWLPREK